MDEKKTGLVLQFARMLVYSWYAALFLLFLYQCAALPYGHFYQRIVSAGYFRWFAFLQAAAVQLMMFMLMAASGICVLYFALSFILLITGHKLECECDKRPIGRPLKVLYASQAILSVAAAVDLCLYGTDHERLPLTTCLMAAISVICMEIFLWHAMRTAAGYWQALKTGQITDC